MSASIGSRFNLAALNVMWNQVLAGSSMVLSLLSYILESIVEVHLFSMGS